MLLGSQQPCRLETSSLSLFLMRNLSPKSSEGLLRWRQDLVHVTFADEQCVSSRGCDLMKPEYVDLILFLSCTNVLSFDIRWSKIRICKQLSLLTIIFYDFRLSFFL